MADQSIIDQLISVRNHLSKKQKVVCDYIIEHHKEISVFSLTELAERIGVGQTTIIRFINSVGYDSYKEFRKHFQQYTLEPAQPTWWHLKKSFTHFKDEEATIHRTWKEIMKLLDESMTQQLVDNFKKAVKLIVDAKTINVAGFRTSKAPAYYFEHMLSEFIPNVRQLSGDSELIYDRLLHLNKDHAVIFIALSPYTKLTVDAAAYAHEKGVPIILITDQLSCPISTYANHILPVKSSKVQYSIVPVITLIETLVIEIGQQISGHSVSHLSELNELLSEKNITIS
jgi:DNA-binding MurR/RpiR family transcriptional regulator